MGVFEYGQKLQLKFSFSEKATKMCAIFLKLNFTKVFYYQTKMNVTIEALNMILQFGCICINLILCLY